MRRICMAWYVLWPYDCQSACHSVHLGLVLETAETIIKLAMWANAQRHGRPAEYGWRPLFNAAVWLTPTSTVPCKTRNPLKFAGVRPPN